MKEGTSPNRSPTIAERKPMNKFSTQGIFCFNQIHPHWKEILKARFGQMKTICIPVCLDVGPHKTNHPLEGDVAGFDGEEAERRKNRVKGNNAEEQFFFEFQKLNLGGILINGFDSQAFGNVMERTGVRFSNVLKQHFECDFIFIHQRIGVVIIEVKGNDADHGSQFTKGTEQLEKIMHGLEHIFNAIYRDHDSDCFFQLQSVLCMPNAQMSPSEYVDRMANRRLSSAPFHFCDKSLLYDGKKFIKFWKSMERPKFSLTDGMIRFITAIIVYRHAKFVSPATNALEIHRMIAQQNFANTKNAPEKIIYNNDQLDAIICISQRVLIIGAPGTGKTICLLERVLQAAGVDKDGRVVIALNWRLKELITWFEQFFIDSASKNKRKPMIIGIKDDDDLTRFTNDDDLFIDEMSLTQNVNFQQRVSGRSLNFGSTTVVITGSWNPKDIIFSKYCLETFWWSFEVFELHTVVRGTKTIINEWQIHFPERYLRVGHNITGAPIQRFSTKSFPKMCAILRFLISDYLIAIPHIGAIKNPKLTEEQNQPLQCKPCHIAILVVSKAYGVNTNAVKIRNQLKARGIKCGTIQQQARNCNLIAVDDAIRALSYEWPIVIIVVFDRSLVDGERYKMYSGYLIASSRAIAKLFVLDNLPRRPSVPTSVETDETDSVLATISPSESDRSSLTKDVASTETTHLMSYLTVNVSVTTSR